MIKNPNKKAQREKNNKQRVRATFNTGTQTHKSKKDYNRQQAKLNTKKSAAALA